MARRSPQTYAKRQREQAKLAKRRAKEAKRALRKAQKGQEIRGYPRRREPVTARVLPLQYDFLRISEARPRKKRSPGGRR